MAVLAWNSSAQAKHIYWSQSCTTKNGVFTLRYTGNYPVGGSYELTRKGIELEMLALPNDAETYGQEELDKADIVFTEKSSVELERPVDRKECEFDHSESKTRKVFSLDKVSAIAREKLALRGITELTMTCEESLDIPNDITCDP